eukprot:13774989-Alexandrium_andersonii.AAC.1
MGHPSRTHRTRALHGAGSCTCTHEGGQVKQTTKTTAPIPASQIASCGQPIAWFAWLPLDRSVHSCSGVEVDVHSWI